MRALLSLLSLALLGACTTHPITGREQIVAMPLVQLAYADIDFSLSSGAQRFTLAMQCGQGCEGSPSMAETANRIATIGARLEAIARSLSPDLFKRITRFAIEVDANPGVRTGSSGSGRIVLSAGLVGQLPEEADSEAIPQHALLAGFAGLDASGIRLAFLIAREMGHVIARHAEENSGASLAASALGLLIPGVHTIVRFVAARVGASAVKDAWAPDQQAEADEIALSLLAQAGLSPLIVSLALQRGVLPPGDSSDPWDVGYLNSARRIAQLAFVPLRHSGSTR